MPRFYILNMVSLACAVCFRWRECVLAGTAPTPTRGILAGTS
ncbi:hypothetical protein HMPREF9278_1234 [Mobiluncus mulieris FB024-16]|nr:hypothetical protein HMPREF9278_1234 [Mobiluncus mulieris FB024-16]